MTSLHHSFQPDQLTDREQMSFNPFDRRFVCAQSGYMFQETDMVYIDFFCDWVSKENLDEYLEERKPNLLDSEYEEIIKSIKK